MAFIDCARALRDILVYTWPDSASQTDKDVFFLPPCRFADAPASNQVTIQDVRKLNKGLDAVLNIENGGARVTRESSTSSFRHITHALMCTLYMQAAKDEKRIANVNTIPYEVARRVMAFPSLKGTSQSARYGEPLPGDELVDTNNSGVPDTLVRNLTPEQIAQGLNTLKENFTFECYVEEWSEADVFTAPGGVIFDAVDVEVVVTEEIYMSYDRHLGSQGPARSRFSGGINDSGIAVPIQAQLTDVERRWQDRD